MTFRQVGNLEVGGVHESTLTADSRLTQICAVSGTCAAASGFSGVEYWTESGVARYPYAMPSVARPPTDRARAPLPSLVLIVAAWLVPAILSGIDTYMQSRLQGGQPPWRWVIYNSIDWLLYAVLTPFVFRLSRRWPLQSPQFTQSILLHVAGALGMCVAWAGLGTLLRLAIFPLAPDFTLSKEFSEFIAWVFTTLPFGVGVYFALLGIEHSLFYLAQARERETRSITATAGKCCPSTSRRRASARRDLSWPRLPIVPSTSRRRASARLFGTVMAATLEVFYLAQARERETQAARLAAQLAEARLGALRMQLNPHFLFNSLNALTVLVRDQNTAAASEMLGLLSDVLHEVLRPDETHETTLTTELEFLHRYLAIERIRFSDRLRPSFEIEPGIGAPAVPRFVFQPLVENALRHGIARRADAGVLVVGARRDGGDLVLTVRDDGPGLAPGAVVSTGVGLGNTRARLAALYGERASLDVANAPGGGVVATVRLPYHEAESDAPRRDPFFG